MGHGLPLLQGGRRNRYVPAAGGVNGPKQSGVGPPKLCADDVRIPTKSSTDSMINVRPSAGNRSRTVEDESVKSRIRQIVRTLVSDA
jgi:hypothetical protein